MAAALPVLGGLVGGALLSKATAAPKIPPPPSVKQAPVLDDKASLAAKQRAQQRRYGMMGREGTALTQQESGLG